MPMQMSVLRSRAEAANSHLRLVILLPAPPGLLYLCFVQLLQSEGKIQNLTLLTVMQQYCGYLCRVHEQGLRSI